MHALVYDSKESPWETSQGFLKREIPEPKLDEAKRPADRMAAIVRVHYAGVCGSDKGIWHRQAFRDQILGSLKTEKKPYRILGHEFCGEITAVGSAVGKRFKLKEGDFVSAESHVVCNECFQCRRGESHVCTNEKILGISHNGCFAEYIKIPAHIIWKTNRAKIRPEVAAVQEPFGNAVHAASKVDLKGKTIALFGLGPIGLFTLLAARGLGAKKIIGVEPNPEARAMAEKLGIDHLINLRASGKPPSPTYDQAVIEEIMKITNGLGVDVAFEMAGFNSSLNNAIHSTRRGGDVILFGLKDGNFVLEDYRRLIVRGLTLHAVIGRQLWQTWETTKKLFENSKNGIQKKIYEVILNQGRGTILPLAEYTNEKFEKLLAAHPKILIRCQS